MDMLCTQMKWYKFPFCTTVDFYCEQIQFDAFYGLFCIAYAFWLSWLNLLEQQANLGDKELGFKVSSLDGIAEKCILTCYTCSDNTLDTNGIIGCYNKLKMVICNTLTLLFTSVDEQ